MNLDMRSLWLNFEASVFLYGGTPVDRVRDLQMGYVADSERLGMDAWLQRPRRHRVAEGLLRLFGPLV